MARFFLHVVDNGELLRDAEGLDCEKAADARAEAIRVVGELLREGLWSAQSHAGRLINIVDSSGATVDIVSLWQMLEGEGAFDESNTDGNRSRG